jgi:ankyrin repeat protein
MMVGAFASSLACARQHSSPSSLVEAVRAGDIAAVRKLIELGADVNSQERKLVGLNAGEPKLLRMTPLLWACMEPKTEVVDVLLQSGADPERSDEEGWTPLMVAAAHSNYRCIKSLLRAGARAASRNKKGETPLEIAAYLGDTPDVLLILEATERTPEAPAIVAKAYDMASKRFGEGSGSHTSTRVLAIHNAVHQGSAKGLLADAIVSKRSVDGLCTEASLDGNVNAPDAEGWTILMWAAGFYGGLDSVNTLLKHGADPNAASKYGWTPLLAAAEVGDAGKIIALLSAGADPNRAEAMNSEQPLHMAVIHGTSKAVDALLKSGAKIEARTKDGRTAVDLVEYQQDANERTLIAEALAKFTPAIKK